MEHLDSEPLLLERALLRRGVGDRARRSQRCTDCGRSPLVGEHIHVYDGGKVACELCRQLRREQPVRSEPVLGFEHDRAVRVRVHRAA